MGHTINNNSKTIKNMKKLFKPNVLGLAIVMSLFTIQLSAQPPGGGPGRGFQRSEEDIKKQVDDLSKNLELSKDQQKKVLDYEMEFNTKMQVEREKMRNNSGDFDRETMRARMTEVREERDAKYGEILTKEQLEKYKVQQEQRRSEMRRQYQEGSPDRQGDRPERGRGRN